jgi:rhodanese-related sulfurtransferase
MSVQTITCQGLKELLAGESDVRLIDVRMSWEFRAVHVVGAKNVPLHRLSAERLAEAVGTDGDTPVYFICKSGQRSQRACEKARGFGVDHVVNVEGGTTACVDAGLEVERGKRTIALECQVRIIAGTLVLVGSVLALTSNPNWAVLPALLGGGLIFSGVTNICGTRRVLAMMPWNR